MGILVHVFRNSLGDSTNRGISSKANMLCLVNVVGPFEPAPDMPPAMIVKGNFPGLVKIVPAWYMDNKWEPVDSSFSMGGNFAYTSDSRFNEMVCRITGGQSYGAVPIHDRVEE